VNGERESNREFAWLFRRLPVIALGVAFVGLVGAAVLTVGHIWGLPIPCGGHSGCAIVAAHPISAIAGVPIAVFGVASYAVIIFLLLRAANAPWARNSLLALTGIGALISIALLGYAQFVIRATCVWCLVSGVAMALLFIIAVFLCRSTVLFAPVSSGLLLLFGGIALSAFGGELWLMQRAASMPPIRPELLKTVSISELLESDHALGPADAEVKIVEFSDLLCSVCRGVHRPLMDFQAAHARHVQLIFKHRPLTWVRGHETSKTAAVFSEIAAERGKFWQFVNRLYAETQEPNVDRYRKVMRDLGIDPSVAEADLSDSRSGSLGIVQRDIALADRLGVRQTPTFVVIITGRKDPMSANHRMLSEILNSQEVQQLLEGWRTEALK
jgi:uncharacterized membrane protein/predicted DsbA family dithiol-disulfide isomerase